jgi:hypothetical protein
MLIPDYLRWLVMADASENDLGGFRVRIKRDGEDNGYCDLPRDMVDPVFSLGIALGRWLAQCETIRQRQSSGRTPGIHRKNAIEAFSGLNDILLEHGCHTGLPEILGRLWVALMSVDEKGQRHVMFEPGATPSATGATFDIITRINIKAEAAALIQFLMEERRYSQRLAAKKVAKALSKGGFNPPGEMKCGAEFRWDTVKRWHTEASKGKATPHKGEYEERIERYRSMKESCPPEKCLDDLPRVLEAVRWTD